jgi:hypothetical protein
MGILLGGVQNLLTGARKRRPKKQFAQQAGAIESRLAAIEKLCY